MNIPPDLLNLRQSVVDLLEADPPQEERLLADFERDAEVVGDDATHPLYSTIIYILTHLTFSEPEARRHWQQRVQATPIEHQASSDNRGYPIDPWL